jgi:hypothetical protein
MRDPSSEWGGCVLKRAPPLPMLLRASEEVTHHTVVSVSSIIFLSSVHFVLLQKIAQECLRIFNMVRDPSESQALFSSEAAPRGAILIIS